MTVLDNLQRSKSGARTVAEALDHGASLLRAAGVSAARRDARLLLALTMAASHSANLDASKSLSSADLARYQGLLSRRENREPVSRIVGVREFWGLEFALSPDTLDPRPDSETLIEAAAAVFTDGAEPRRILDLGTGSGCLLCAALHEFSAATGVGVDRLAGAALMAKRNAKTLGLGRRASFVVGNWGDALGDRGFDLVLTNPPYICDSEILSLEPEVSRFDPRAALSGGADGLGAYRTLIPAAARVLAPAGTFIAEIGAGQAAEVTGLMIAARLQVREIRRDLAGIQRCIVATPG